MLAVLGARIPPVEDEELRHWAGLPRSSVGSAVSGFLECSAAVERRLTAEYLRTAWKGARSGNEGVVGGYDEEEGVGMHFQLPGGWLHVYIFFYV